MSDSNSDRSESVLGKRNLASGTNKHMFSMESTEGNSLIKNRNRLQDHLNFYKIKYDPDRPEDKKTLKNWARENYEILESSTASGNPFKFHDCCNAFVSRKSNKAALHIAKKEITWTDFKFNYKITDADSLFEAFITNILKKDSFMPTMNTYHRSFGDYKEELKEKDRMLETFSKRVTSLELDLRDARNDKDFFKTKSEQYQKQHEEGQSKWKLTKESLERTIMDLNIKINEKKKELNEMASQLTLLQKKRPKKVPKSQTIEETLPKP